LWFLGQLDDIHVVKRFFHATGFSAKSAHHGGDIVGAAPSVCQIDEPLTRPLSRLLSLQTISEFIVRDVFG
jgi:hypothetical protein